MYPSELRPGQRPCPYCGVEMECDEVDIGIGCIQCGPYHCWDCGASEIGPERYKKGETREQSNLRLGLDADEAKTGFYKGRISPHANMVDGVLVDHHTAKKFYEIGLLDPKPDSVEK